MGNSIIEVSQGDYVYKAILKEYIFSVNICNWLEGWRLKTKWTVWQTWGDKGLCRMLLLMKIKRVKPKMIVEEELKILRRKCNPNNDLVKY